MPRTGALKKVLKLMCGADMLKAGESLVGMYTYVRSSKSCDVSENAATDGNKRRRRSAEKKKKTLPVLHEGKLAQIDGRSSDIANINLERGADH